MTYQDTLNNKYVQAALSVRMKQPQLSECANFLAHADRIRFETKGKWMTEDHLKQEARKWHERRT